MTTGQRQSGITFLTKQEAQREYLESPYSLTGDINNIRQLIENTTSSYRPLLITGEYGTGRTAVASWAYFNSTRAAHPLVEIDCGMLTDRSREFLLSGRSSPLYSSNLTLHIKNMDASTEPFLNELLTTIAKLYLSQLNANIPKEVLRIDRQAMQLLSEYSWPGNYIQFKRLISQLCLISRDHTIRSADVRTLLAQERPAIQQVTDEGGEGTELDLRRPLAQIERDIAELVVQQNGGNQSAARQPGISRTTLWRMTRTTPEQ